VIRQAMQRPEWLEVCHRLRPRTRFNALRARIGLTGIISWLFSLAGPIMFAYLLWRSR
jgi:hypothetical protein